MSPVRMSFMPKPSANKTHGPYTVHPGVAMVLKWIEELPGKTGRSLEEWIALTKTSGPPDGERTTRMAQERTMAGPEYVR